MRSGMRILAACGLVGLTLGVVAADDGFFTRSRSSYDTSSRRSAEYFSRNTESEWPAEAAAQPGAESPTTNDPFLAETAGRYSRGDNSTAQGETNVPEESPLPGVRNYHKALFGTERPSRYAGQTQTAQTPPAAQQQRPPQQTAQRPAAQQPSSPWGETTRSNYGAGNATAGTSRITRPTANPFAAEPRTAGIGAAAEKNVFSAEFQNQYNQPARPRIEQVRATEQNVSPFTTRQAAAPAATPPAATENRVNPFAASSDDGENPFAAFERSRSQQPAVAPPAEERPQAPARPSRTAARTTPRPTTTAAVGPPPSPRSRGTVTTTRPLMAEAMVNDAAVSMAAPVSSQTPTVTVNWVKKSEINVGQPCDCDLVVRNTGRVPAKDVTVEAWFPQFVRLTTVTPEPSQATDHLEWTFASLAAGEEQIIQISMIPSRRGDLATSANVRFTNTASSVFTVEEPMLDLQIKGPSDVLLGDPASQILVVSNPGTGMANNVVIEAVIPRGLEHPRGERLMLEIGSLNPNESRQVRLALSTVEGGRHRLQVVARAESELQQELSTDITVIAPSVLVAADGPAFRYIGRNAAYVLTVTNDGTVASNNVRVTHRVPAGFKFVRADRGGSYDSATQTASWFVGRLDAGQTTTLKAEFDPTQPGRHIHQVEAVTDQGARSETQLETEVAGTASLVLEIVDLDDPVEVGVETAYEVRVRNNGTAAAQNVAIACELEAGIELIHAKGPTESGREAGQIVFQPLPQLEPGKTALYRVHVRGKGDGNHRFRARLASESIDEPLIFEENTKFYGEGE